MKWMGDSHNRKCVVDGEVKEYDILVQRGDPFATWPPAIEGAAYVGIGKIWSIDGKREAVTDGVFAFYRFDR